jgi:hypothetical protein
VHNLLWDRVIAFLLTGLGTVTAFAFRNSASAAVMPGSAETTSVRVSVPAIEVDALLVPGR